MKAGASLKAEATSPARSADRYLSIAAWVAALSLAALALYLGWRLYHKQPVALAAVQQAVPRLKSGLSSETQGEKQTLPIPELVKPTSRPAISPDLKLLTIIPNRPPQEVRPYSVSKGDSVFEIAARFNLKPESVLWANYDQLNDNPDLISLGMQLNIPPTDGVLYQWQEGDTLQMVASRFEARVEDILNWPSNKLDLVDPQILPGAMIMLPGGHREFRQWLIPTIPRGSAGVSSSLYGDGACTGSYEGAYGTGAFIWPAGNHALSGNDYWDGHLGIDIAVGEGAPVMAADSGVVVFAGWANFGYGSTVMVDHGNGYQTLYAHLSSVATSCGRSVSQAQTIGYAGSTGNSTGAHLHFEVRYLGGFISPWYALPAP